MRSPNLFGGRNDWILARGSLFSKINENYFFANLVCIYLVEWIS